MHGIDPLRLSGLIEQIYAAASDPALWPQVLTEVGSTVSGGTQTLLFVAGEAQLPPVLRCNSTPDSVLDPFLDYYAGVNVLAEPCDRLFQPGDIRYSHHAVADNAFERSEFYTDFFRPNRLFYSCGIKHTTPVGALQYLSLQRGKAQGGFTPGETAVLSLLMPHLRQALAMQAQLVRGHHQACTSQAALSAFGKAVFATDATGNVVFASPDAEAVLRRGNALVLRKGRLRAVHPRADVQLQHRLRSVLGLSREFVQTPCQAMILPQRNPAPGWQCSMASAAQAAVVRGFRRTRDLRLVLLPLRHTHLHGSAHTGGEPGALVCISEDAAMPDSPNTEPQPSLAPVLRALFPVTPLEARIAELLYRGLEVKAIADILGKTEAATRFHVKQLLHKTGSARQADLIRLLSSLPQSPALHDPHGHA